MHYKHKQRTTNPIQHTDSSISTIGLRLRHLSKTLNVFCVYCINPANLIDPDIVNSDNNQSLLCYDKWKDSTTHKHKNVLLICVNSVKLDLFYKVEKITTSHNNGLGELKIQDEKNKFVVSIVKFQPSATSFIDKACLEKALSLIKNILEKMIWQEVKQRAKRLKQDFT